MDKYSRSNGSIVQKTRTSLDIYMSQVYGWMSCGLLLTAVVAWYTFNTPALAQVILSNKVLFVGLVIAQLGVVFGLSLALPRLTGAMATSLFMLYSLLTGLTASIILLRYTGASIASTFLIAAGMFGSVSIYGYTTKRDLSNLRGILFMSLIGIILASVVNIWLQSTQLMWAVTYIGVVLFVAMTAYDTQNIKNMAAHLNMSDSEVLRKASIIGALKLYLNFINLFINLLRILGDRR